MPTNDSRRPKFKTCVRLNEAGQAHALTFSCFKRLPLLSKDRTREWLAASIVDASRKGSFDVWAYVFMPEHIHLLVSPREKMYSVEDFLFAVKFPVAKKAIAYLKKNAPQFLESITDRQPSGRTNFRFWERGGGYDRNVTEPETLLNEIQYIHANPVKRGLVEKESDWNWSSAADYLQLREGPIPIAFGSLPFELGLANGKR